MKQNKNYRAWLNDITNIKLTEKQFKNMETRTIKYGEYNILCKIIVTDDKNGNEFFVLYPINNFEIEVKND